MFRFLTSPTSELFLGYTNTPKIQALQGWHKTSWVLWTQTLRDTVQNPVAVTILFPGFVRALAAGGRVTVCTMQKQSWWKMLLKQQRDLKAHEKNHLLASYTRLCMRSRVITKIEETNISELIQDTAGCYRHRRKNKYLKNNKCHPTVLHHYKGKCKKFQISS